MSNRPTPDSQFRSTSTRHGPGSSCRAGSSAAPRANLPQPPARPTAGGVGRVRAQGGALLSTPMMRVVAPERAYRPPRAVHGPVGSPKEHNPRSVRGLGSPSERMHPVSRADSSPPCVGPSPSPRPPPSGHCRQNLPRIAVSKPQRSQRLALVLLKANHRLERTHPAQAAWCTAGLRLRPLQVPRRSSSSGPRVTR